MYEPNVNLLWEEKCYNGNQFYQKILFEVIDVA